MPIEAELKARLRDPDHVRAELARRAAEEVAVYSDTYFDSPDGTFTGADRELRVREVRTDAGVRSFLTYKGAAVDEASGSKPEAETQVADAAATRDILAGLGFVVEIAFEKHCSNYRFTHAGRDMLATVVRVPEIDGTFVEIETIVDERDVAGALDDVRAVLTELGIDRGDETTETYTGAVRAARG
ncbi:class IV adenylate cyclase [Pseudonocardia sp. CA-107938]|uniref:class IV adenylate cyclase n=1 Tax=Pseudonocardia sp. CA-107938 TaxID=3240021 RepID=UPI003D8FBBEA